MGVNFGSGNAFVAEHLLDCAQVCSVFQKMGCKGMPKGMWADGFAYSSLFRQTFYYGENHCAGERFSSSV